MIPYIDMHCDTIAIISGSWSPEEPGNGQKARRLRENDLRIDLGRLQKGGCLCQCFALFTELGDVREHGESPFRHVCALSDALDREIAENSDLIRPAYSASDIRRHAAAGLLSSLKTIEEGGVFEGKLEYLYEMYRRGVRKATLTWNYPNELGYPNPSPKRHPYQKDGRPARLDTENGLTNCGISFVREMERIGMLIDLSHLNDAGIRDVFLHTRPETPVLASHSNARGVAFHPRNLSDEMIRMIAARGGVTGINFYSEFLRQPPAKTADGGADLGRIEDMIAHMKYIRNLGGIDMIGLGTDFDGFGDPSEIADAGQMQKLADAMSLSGFTTDEIEKVFYKNVLRVYEAVLG